MHLQLLSLRCCKIFFSLSAFFSSSILTILFFSIVFRCLCHPRRRVRIISLTGGLLDNSYTSRFNLFSHPSSFLFPPKVFSNLCHWSFQFSYLFVFLSIYYQVFQILFTYWSCKYYEIYFFVVLLLRWYRNPSLLLHQSGFQLFTTLWKNYYILAWKTSWKFWGRWT